MYQGKNRTALASQRQIAGALRDLMLERPYDEISVAELCRRAGVSRQTFYSLFHAKDNVVIYLLREKGGIREILQAAEGDNQLRQLCRAYGRYVVQRREVLRLLADNGITDMLYEIFHEFLCDDDRFYCDLLEEYREYMADFLAAGLTGLTETFVRQELDADVIEEIVYRLLSGRCRK